MPKPTFTTSKETTHVHEINTRTPDWFDWLTVILPVFVTLLTFYLAYKLNDKFADDKERKRLDDVKEYFLTLAKFLSSVVERQSNVIGNATDIVQLMTDASIKIGIYPELNTTRIRAIPDLDLYKIFIANKADIETSTNFLNTISSALDSIDIIKTDLENFNTEFAKEVLLYNDRYNKLSNALADENAQIIKSGTVGAIIKDSESFELHRLYTMYSRDLANQVKKGNIANGDVTKRYDYFINPLYRETRGIRENTHTYDMLNNIAIMNKDYNNLLHDKASAILIVKDILTNCNTVKNNLNSACEYLKQ